jgi:hypothetical protein
MSQLKLLTHNILSLDEVLCGFFKSKVEMRCFHPDPCATDVALLVAQLCEEGLNGIRLETLQLQSQMLSDWRGRRNLREVRE